MIQIHGINEDVSKGSFNELFNKPENFKLLPAAPESDLRQGIKKRHYFPIKMTTYDIDGIETTIVHLPERYISGVDPYEKKS